MDISQQKSYSISDVRRAVRAQARVDMRPAYEAYERAVGRDPVPAPPVKEKEKQEEENSVETS